MCVWGHCLETDTTQRCRFCGTKICTACLRGDFVGVATDLERCMVCRSGNKFLEAIPNPHARSYTAEHLAEIRRQKAEERGSSRSQSKKIQRKKGKVSKKSKEKKK